MFDWILDSNAVATRAALARALHVQVEGPSNPTHQPAESNQSLQKHRLDIQRQQRDLEEGKRGFAAFVCGHLLMTGRPIIYEPPQVKNLLGRACVGETALANVLYSLIQPVIEGPGYNPTLATSARSINSHPVAETLIAPVVPNVTRLRTLDVPPRLGHVYNEGLRFDPVLPSLQVEKNSQIGHEEWLAREYQARGRYYPRLIGTQDNAKLFRQIDEHIRLKGAKSSDIPRFSTGEPLTECVKTALLPVGWTMPPFTHFSGKFNPDFHLMKFQNSYGTERCR